MISCFEAEESSSVKWRPHLPSYSCEDSVKSFTESDKLMLGRNGNV